MLFFNHIICEFVENSGKLLECARSMDDGADFPDWGMAADERRRSPTEPRRFAGVQALSAGVIFF